MIKLFNYNASPIQFEVIDGRVMANATLMCSAFGKRFNDWFVLASTKKYLDAITRKNGNSEYQLVITKAGSSENGGGAWVDETLVLPIARWLSVDFELWCDDRIAELVRTGSVSLEKPKTLVELHFESAKILLDHENKINEISSKLDKMIEVSQANEAAIKALPISSEPLPELPLRDKVRMMVNSYAASKFVDIKSVWDAAYSKLYYTYNISVNAYKSVKKGQSKLDLIDEKGHTGKLYIIVSDMCRNANVKTI